VSPAQAHVLRVWEWRVWVLLLYALPLHEATKNVLWALAVALALARVAGGGPARGGGLVGLALALWLACGAWSSLFAIEPAASWKGLWDMARAAGMFWLALGIADTPERRLSAIRHLALSTALAALFGIGGYFSAIFVHKAYVGRLGVQLPSVGHHNHSGVYLAMGWLVALAATLRGRFLGGPRAALAACMVLVVALVGSTSRSSIAVAAVATLALLKPAGAPPWLKRVLLYSIPVLVLALCATPWLNQRFYARGSFGARLNMWRSAADAVSARPWTGVGLNNFKNVMLSSGAPSQFATVDHAHNLYVNSLAQGGWPGLLALLAMLGSAALLVARLRSAACPDDRLVFHAAAGVCFVAAFSGFSNTSLHHELAMFFFLVIGLAAAAEKPKLDPGGPSC
jgi:O-antigen ligase